jgi:hypothetical protein
MSYLFTWRCHGNLAGTPACCTDGRDGVGGGPFREYSKTVCRGCDTMSSGVPQVIET